MRTTSPRSMIFFSRLKALGVLGAALALVFAAFVFIAGADRAAEAQQTPMPAAPSAGQLTLQLRGAQRAFTDTVRSVLLEHDPPKAWDLMIVGAKGKGQFTCEVRSADRTLLFALHRAIADGKEVSVSCVDGTPSTRGGVMIDLDDAKGGSFVLGASR